MSSSDTSSKSEFSVIGTRPPRVDAPDKAAGRALYGPDIRLPRMAYGKILRSPHAHARILNIDTRRAEALPGVYAVVTARDMRQVADRMGQVGEVAINFKYLCDNNLASDKALYMGHAVAAVAASSPHIAEDACKLIDVDYEVLPPVVDVLEAMREDAPLLHEGLRTDAMGELSERPSNICESFQYAKGDLVAGFALADAIVEREFRTATVHQGYLEPHAATASWSPDGSLTLYTTTQGSWDARAQVAEPLGLAETQIRVIPTEVGGAFGGKNIHYVDVAAALLARAAARPVRIAMSRAEVLLGSGPASSTLIRIKAGARRDGRLTAVQAKLYYEAGAYPGGNAGGGAYCMLAPYVIPCGLVEGYDVVVNKPKVGPYRAPSAPQAAYAMESVLDELAGELGLDPIEFRLRNCAHEGSERFIGRPHRDIACEEVLRAAQAHPHYRAPLGDPNRPDDGQRTWPRTTNEASSLASGGRTTSKDSFVVPPSGGFLRGRGVALGYWGNGGGRSSATLNVNDDGTLSLVTGSVDLCGTRTSLAMQAAEMLGLPLELFRSTVGDTDTMGHSDSTGGSRTTNATGIAVIEAAKDVIAQMKARAAALWTGGTGETPVVQGDVAYERGVFSATTSAGPQQIGFAELAGRAVRFGGPVRGTGDVNVHGSGASFALHIADVEVDSETGKVTILRYTAVQDVGRAIHPGQIEGQIQGAVAQGIGWALYEGYAYDGQGRMLNANSLDYKMPTALDVPPIEVLIVESPWAGHPYGVRGVGEVPIVPPLAAIANAIHSATGVRVCDLPMTPERVLQAMGVI